MDDLFGGAWYDSLLKYPKRVIDAIRGARKHAPPDLREYLRLYGDYQIVTLTVCRKPIFKEIEDLLNIISFGAFKKRKKEYGYDTLFHLYLFAVLRGRNETIPIKMEKNEVVRIYKSARLDDKEGTCEDVTVNKAITFREFLANGEALQGPDFWLYDGDNNNCQVFVYTLLKANELGNNAIYQFVKQNTEGLLIDPLKKIGRFVTDWAGRVDIVLRGLGYIEE